MILVMSATSLCWCCDLELVVMSSGESHDQSEPNSSAKEVKTTPPRCDGTLFGVSRWSELFPELLTCFREPQTQADTILKGVEKQ